MNTGMGVSDYLSMLAIVAMLVLYGCTKLVA